MGWTQVKGHEESHKKPFFAVRPKHMRALPHTWTSNALGFLPILFKRKKGFFMKQQENTVSTKKELYLIKCFSENVSTEPSR